MAGLSIKQICDKAIENHFEAHPFVEVFELKPFRADENALLHDFFSADKNIPCDPEVSTHPCLLLHDLENQANKKKTVYKHIDENKGHCIGLYGTSGAGKTRSTLEYLSHNLGLYFVADTKNDAGSRDLQSILILFESSYGNEASTLSLGGDETERKLIEKSEKNYRRMRAFVELMVYVRNAVYKAINNQLTSQSKEQLTPYQWLLIQLYPQLALHDDVFDTVLRKGVQQQLESLATGAEDGSVQRDLFADQPVWTVMVVDETQVLLKKLNSFFLSSKTKETPNLKSRSAFSALLKGLDHVNKSMHSQACGYPVFAGTGMSLEDYEEEANSFVAKRPNRDVGRTNFVFGDFPHLDPDGVKRYLSSILNLEKEKLDENGVMDHVSKWLRGRPRWTASFVEVYLFREKNNDHFERQGEKKPKATRGSFSSSEAKLVQALDRYIASYTTGEKTDDSRRGSHTPTRGSAYAAIEKAITQNMAYDVKRTLETAIFKYTVGGLETIYDDNTYRLIEFGVAALRTIKPGSYSAVLNEPIMAEAGINWFTLEAATASNLLGTEKGGQGEAFEKVMLPAIQGKLIPLLKTQQTTSEYKVLSKYDVSVRSAYGVLAKSCKDNIDGTLDWIEEATQENFEGRVPPFCYPDDHFGPDLIFLMWDSKYTEYCGCLAQAKFREDLNQREALLSITPALLYHQNRGKAQQSLSEKLTTEMQKRWEKVKPNLIGEDKDHGCLRLMVQYPCHEKRNAAPGIVRDECPSVVGADKLLQEENVELGMFEQEEVEPGIVVDTESVVVRVGQEEEKKRGEKRKHGWLSTVSLDNASLFFGKNAMHVMKHLKGKET